jgi:hypothetical protein
MNYTLHEISAFPLTVLLIKLDYVVSLTGIPSTATATTELHGTSV